MFAIVLLGFLLRKYQYELIPRHGATFDEFAWTWLGVNLIQKGVPISWSSQPQYTDRRHLVYQGAKFWIVTPYLEHPPLFGLVAGGFALVNGVHDMYGVTLAKIRPLSLFLGVLSILMIFLLSSSVYGKGVAMLAALLYATVPSVVIGSRLVQNENFLIPFWLLSLWFIFKYLKTGRNYFRNTAAVIAGLLSLAKVPWLVVGLSLAMILSYHKKWRDAVVVSAITVGIFSIYILYALYWDRGLFLNLLRLQTARYDISFAGFFSIFTNPLLVDRFYLDGWIYFGWFAIVLIAKEFRKHLLILLPFIAYFITYIFAIPNEPAHGWYRYPFYPFLIISASLVLIEEFKKTSLVSLFFLVMVGLALLYSTWQSMFGFSYFLYRLFILLAAGSILLPFWFKKATKASRVIMNLWLGLFLILNILAVYQFIDI